MKCPKSATAPGGREGNSGWRGPPTRSSPRSPPEGVLATGREAIREALRPTFALRAPTAQIDVLEKLESDGLALTQANWFIGGTDHSGAAVELAGRGAIVTGR